MQLTHTFSVPAPVDDAWTILRDIERIAPCMPGATIESVDGDEFTGRVKVKVGPMQVTYRGSAAFVEVDDDRHRAVIEARGKEVRGAGTATATIAAELRPAGEERTEVAVVTDLAVTGRPAQFGRGVMADVGDKLLGRFAECLGERLAGAAEPGPEAVATGAATAATGAEPATGAQPPPEEGRVVDLAQHRPTPEAIDLVDVAGVAVLRRLAPALAALALLALLVWAARRRDS